MLLAMLLPATLLLAGLPARPLAAAAARQEPPVPVEPDPVAQLPYDTAAVEAAAAASLAEGAAPLDATPGASLFSADAAPAAVDVYPLQNQGLPLLGPTVINDATPGAHSVRTADFDADGDLDILSAARDSGQIIWYRNNGSRTPNFEPRQIAIAPGAYLALPTDLNMDGKIDVVVVAVGVVDPSRATPASGDAPAAALGSGALLWLQNDGQPVPGFAARTVAAGLNYPVSAAVGDLDGDGDPDLVAATRDDNSITWFASSGGPAPSFAPRPITNAAGGAVSVDVGDADHDGDLDVVSASEDDDRILLFANNGAGAFAATAVRPGAPQPDLDFAKSVRFADIEGDGDQDIAYVSEDQNEVGWYINNGARPPAWTQRVVTAGNATHTKFVTSADMDNDGDMDLLSAWSGLEGQGSAVLWHRNDGQPGAGFASFVVTTAAIGARYVHAADLDGDGDQDLLTASRDDGRILWFVNYSPHRTAQLPASGQHSLGNYFIARHIIAADIDGDGDRDMLSVGDQAFVWHENNGAQPPSFTQHAIPAAISGARWADAADLDRDGDLDLILAATNSGTVYWYENNGAKPPTFTERVAVSELGGPRSAVAADIDRDGDIDIAVPSDEDHRLLWLENSGARPATFVPHTVEQASSANGYFRTVWPADMDRDGDIDLVSASSNGGKLLLFTNNGARPPSFGKREIGSAAYPQHVHVDDVDGDGDPDVLLASEGDSDLSLFTNADGRAGSFVKSVIDDDAPQIHAVVTGDADLDGDLDLFAAVEGSNSFNWYENNGQPAPAFGERVIFNLATRSHGVNVADIDGDGDLDVMGAARESGLVAWFENYGGQFRLNEVGFTQRTVGGVVNSVTALQAQHAGREYDAPVQVATLDIRFVSSTGALLTTAELAARARAVAVYIDSAANGQYDPGADRLLVRETRLDQASGGRLILSLRTATPPVDIGQGGSAILFVVAEQGGACANDTLVRPLVRATAQTGADSMAGSPLRAEYESTGGGALLEIDPPRQLRINEISANSYIDGYEVDDWIEIYNPGPQPVQMGGMYVTDNVNDPKKFKLPPSLWVPVGGFVVIVADDDGDALHANFKLSQRGETVGLFDADSRLNRPLDIVTFGDQPDNTTSGRWPDGGATWRQLPAPSLRTFNVTAGQTPRLYFPLISKQTGC